MRATCCCWHNVRPIPLSDPTGAFSCTSSASGSHPASSAASHTAGPPVVDTTTLTNSTTVFAAGIHVRIFTYIFLLVWCFVDGGKRRCGSRRSCAGIVDEGEAKPNTVARNTNRCTRLGGWRFHLNTVTLSHRL